jgi:hypothetical protein
MYVPVHTRTYLSGLPPKHLSLRALPRCLLSTCWELLCTGEDDSTRAPSLLPGTPCAPPLPSDFEVHALEDVTPQRTMSIDLLARPKFPSINPLLVPERDKNSNQIQSLELDSVQPPSINWAEKSCNDSPKSPDPRLSTEDVISVTADLGIVETQEPLTPSSLVTSWGVDVRI